MMTFDQACALRNRTHVHLASGTTGVLVVWHKATEVVGIAVPGRPGLYDVPCRQLAFDDAGRVVELSPTRNSSGSTCG